MTGEAVGTQSEGGGRADVLAREGKRWGGGEQAQPTAAHHPVAEVQAHDHLLEDPPRLVLRQPVVQAALAQEAVQLRGRGRRGRL